MNNKFDQRYHVHRSVNRFLTWNVKCGNGNNEIFSGTKKQCEKVASALLTAFRDGQFVQEFGILTGEDSAQDPQIKGEFE